MEPSAEELLERAAERANIAHTIFMLLDADADGIVGVEQVGHRRSTGADNLGAREGRAVARGGCGGLWSAVAVWGNPGV